MKRADYQAGPAGDVQVQEDGDRWTLVFVRELRHPPQRVWAALTDPAELRQWAPFDPDRNLGKAGAASLTMAGAPKPEAMAADVRRAEFATLLEYSWGEDLLRWELVATANGTRLTLKHTVKDRTWLPKVTAGWHICIDVAERMLDGDPVGRVVADEALQHGWERLNDEYAERLGITSTGWPA
jgi:uncharacterized protein YndB with AHSA1/START domain